MRIALLLRPLLVALLLFGGTMAILVINPLEVAVAGDNDNDNDDDNSGRGNNDDEDDDKGSRGRGNDDDKKPKKNNTQEVIATEEYQVEVTCEPASETETTCTFSPVVPENERDVSHLVVPDDLICADVIGGNGTYVDADPNVDVTGYRFTGSGPYTIVLEGDVSTTGTATYWVKAANGVYPASGSGLACATEDSVTSLPDSPEATPPTAPATGTIVIEVHACTGLTSESKDVDWFGVCTSESSAHRFLLEPVDEPESQLQAARTADSGVTTFSDLAPGAYDLEDADARWCHAKSDRVNTDGQVVVEAGTTSTVWLFYCHEEGS